MEVEREMLSTHDQFRRLLGTLHAPSHLPRPHWASRGSRSQEVSSVDSILKPEASFAGPCLTQVPRQKESRTDISLPDRTCHTA